ncbi:16S rRNA (guanine(966)-N(2))-methyltransferase RsmD [Shewanella litorisediminis]|uniref:Ribosomal RNA small subunit methyltransferase D n=1 Tax=Shewanella litorisediminis TaxID=1173586 RepID=A0ABX7G2X8_9GAMM|nr:16S rRNA (guanine(966)-N(2))-methyltransferase RsmD [Shewanella litorisediminis]MCL2917205.1 16S rRNA (guanine(966)-N(2))-methyltransferase RsmD [Shewanella litorisediminis]QRH01680.1 16S rRNA (guanine(966)-N(2))-methyltransferase RsmD [Shewanella litorisediminis]
MSRNRSSAGRGPGTKASGAMGSGQVRIIGGQWRSRKLPIKDLEGLRPTTDRVRETLFNWIAADLPHARVLDCFGGSGALALEALSRYASFAKVFELQREAANQLKANLQTLKCDCAEVVNGDTLALLAAGAAEGFDIVFIDPPFRKGLADATLIALKDHGWLNEDALVYLETESELVSMPLPQGFTELKHKTAGQVCYRLLQFTPGEQA